MAKFYNTLWPNEPDKLYYAVYYGYGLCLYRSTGAVATLLIGAAIFIFQLLFSRWWLSKHKQGPFEYLWRKATWMGYKRI